MELSCVGVELVSMVVASAVCRLGQELMLDLAISMVTTRGKIRSRAQMSTNLGSKCIWLYAAVQSKSRTIMFQVKGVTCCLMRHGR